MGFMDKLKNAGKSALRGALAIASTTYGTVLSGKYESYKIAGLGDKRDSLTFVMGTVVEEPLVIKDNIKTFTVEIDDDVYDNYCINLVFNDGETSLVKVNVEPNKDSPSEKYRNAALLVSALVADVPEVSNDTKCWANKIMKLQNKTI